MKMNTRKLSALLTAACLLVGLLSGCGNSAASAASAAASSAASAASEASAAAPAGTTEAAAEPASAAEAPASGSAETEEALPEDPTELGAYLWNAAEEVNTLLPGIDYDQETGISITIDGETSDSRVTTHCKYLLADDVYTAYVSNQNEGVSTEMWYGDGYACLDGPYGSYKAPMDAEDFHETYIASGTDLDLDAESFETITGTVTDTGYEITFSNASLDTWMEFESILGIDEVEDMECTAFGFSGTYELNQDFVLVSEDLALNISYNVMDTDISETVTLNLKVNDTGDAVEVSLPSDPTGFKEVSDIEIPNKVVDGANSLLNQTALAYSDTAEMVIGDDSTSDDNVAVNTFAYTYDGEDLTAEWEYSETVNDALYAWYNDTFENGTYTVTNDNGTEESEMDTADYYQYIYNQLYGWIDTFDYGTDYTLTHESEYDVVTYTVEDADVIAQMLQSYLTNFSYDTAVTDADSIDVTTAEISLYFWPDGMMIGQSVTLSASLDFQGTVLTLDISELGEILTDAE